MPQLLRSRTLYDPSTTTPALRLRVMAAFFALLAACATPDAPPPAPYPPSPVTKADTVVYDAIAAAGQWGLDTATASFRFRDKTYGLDRRDGLYVYTRAFTDSTGAAVADVLTNEGFARTTDGRATRLNDEAGAAAREALNSVIYFAFLPRWLADPAARRAYEGLDTLRGQSLHRVRVTFSADGGGTDFRDAFLYWFDADDLSLDYLAYSYATDGGGVRFRESYNERAVGGVTVRDYRNYAPGEGVSLPLEQVAEAWAAGRLELLSTVALEDVRVTRGN